MKNQTEIKSIGIWMDHAEAKFIDPEKIPSTINVIHSQVISRVRIPGESADGTRLGGYHSTNNEFKKHNKKQNEVHAYYKQLAEALQPYDEILIFGPTTAGKEFHNFLLKEMSFTGKKIRTMQENYLTENQLAEYVRNNLR